MSLDLDETLLQLDQVAQRLDLVRDDRQARLQRLVAAAAQVAPPDAKGKTRYPTGRGFLTAQVEDSLLGRYAPAALPADWNVVSVDGSHIDVDRHIPISCYLINLGGCTLTYGANPDARLFSRARLFSEDRDLYLTDPSSPAHEESVTGPLLGLVRTVRELQRLVEVVRECPPTLPTLALVDGSLVLWGLSGRGGGESRYASFVREAILQEGLLAALNDLRNLAQHRLLTLAAYTSLPRSTEVVNALRCCLCPHDLSQCRQSCSNRHSVHAPCDAANDLRDRDLFEALLEEGWRSPIYRTNSSVSRESYGEHQVHFYYLNVGEEIARVEVPQWVARDETLLSLGHSLILDQCRRGQGYPVAISEAHQQAVIGGADRQMFRRMVAEVLDRRGLPVYTSEKERSKHLPWV
jgi:hypothetical protein